MKIIKPTMLEAVLVAMLLIGLSSCLGSGGREEQDIWYDILKRWFDKYDKVVSGVSGLLLLIGLLLTCYQIWRTKRMAQADTIFRLKIEGSKILDSLKDDSDVYDYITNYTNCKKYSQQTIQKAYAKMNIIVNYYATAYHLRRCRVLDRRVWNVMMGEFILLTQCYPFKIFWKKIVMGGPYDEDFKKLPDSLPFLERKIRLERFGKHEKK